MHEPLLAGAALHPETREVLERLFRSGRIPNGLLFLGESGVGKRTVALAFARSLLAGDPEGRVDAASPAARKLAAAVHPDLELVVRESRQRQIGIDRIRALKETFSLTPAEAERRVAIVVDAERLTEEAGNALLKLLEEPPPGSHLILTARDLGAVMPTLVSRCVRIPIRLLDTGEIEGLLAACGIAADRRPLLAAMAEGRPGLARRMAEEAQDEEVFGRVVDLLDARGAPFAVAGELVLQARAVAEVVELAREQLRPVLGLGAWTIRKGLEAAAGSEASRRAIELLPERARSAMEGRSPAELEHAARSFLAAMSDLDASVSPELVLENLALDLAPE